MTYVLGRSYCDSIKSYLGRTKRSTPPEIFGKPVRIITSGSCACFSSLSDIFVLTTFLSNDFICKLKAKK